MKTYNELIEIAKQKKVKHYRRYKKHELEKIFELGKKIQLHSMKNIVKKNGK